MLENVPGARADLRAKVTEAWREFAGALATLVPTLTPGSHVDITLDPTAPKTALGNRFDFMVRRAVPETQPFSSK